MYTAKVRSVVLPRYKNHKKDPTPEGTYIHTDIHTYIQYIHTYIHDIHTYIQYINACAFFVF